MKGQSNILMKNVENVLSSQKSTFIIWTFDILILLCLCRSGPEVIKHFSCSTQLRMIFFLLINVTMPTIVGILTFMSGKIAF